MRKPVLIVICGPNGSGKTSTTHLVIKHEWAFAKQYVNSIPEWADKILKKIQ